MRYPGKWVWICGDFSHLGRNSCGVNSSGQISYLYILTFTSGQPFSLLPIEDLEALFCKKCHFCRLSHNAPGRNICRPVRLKMKEKTRILALKEDWYCQRRSLTGWGGTGRPLTAWQWSPRTSPSPRKNDVFWQKFRYFLVVKCDYSCNYVQVWCLDA